MDEGDENAREPVVNRGDIEMIETPFFNTGTLGRDRMSRLNVKMKEGSKTPKKNPYEYYPQLCNTVRKAESAKRDAQIESVIEMIEQIQKLNRPRGLVLNPEMVSVPRKEDEVDFIKTAEVLGKGSGSGEVIMVKDRNTKKDIALKTIMLSQFNRDEIWAWVHLMDEKKAPELYHFELKDNKVVFTMEVMKGKTIQEVIESNKFTDPLQARQLSLLVLNDLLTAFESLRSVDYTHGDMHGGNVMLEPSLSIKLFDFGETRKLLKEASNDSRRIKNDVIGIIRMFCALYSGVDFYSLDEARESLQANDFHEISKNMQHIPEDQRKELFSIMSMLFDTVRDQMQPEYGDTSKVAAEIKDQLPKDIEDWKKKAAVIIFPEKFQDKEECDGGFKHEAEVEDSCGNDFNPVWDDPQLEDYAESVTEQELRQLGVTLQLLDDESNI